MKIVFEKSLVFSMLILFHAALKSSQELTVENLRDQIWRNTATNHIGIAGGAAPSNNIFEAEHKAHSGNLSELYVLAIS